MSDSRPPRVFEQPHRELRVEITLTALAAPPSQAEREAIAAAVNLALWPSPVVRTPVPAPWRFSGRWWQGASGANRGFPPPVDELWKTGGRSWGLPAPPA
jgi:hypothetical protein